MYNHFNYYDAICIFAPGSMAIIGLSIFPIHENGISFKELLHMNIGGSLLLIFSVYILGEFIQGMGKLFEKLFWGLMGGLPTNWVDIDEKESKGLRKSMCRKCGNLLRTLKITQIQDIISDSSKNKLQQYLEKEDESFSTISKNFKTIQTEIMQNKDYYSYLNRVLARANMFRGLVILFLFNLVIYCALHERLWYIIGLIILLLLMSLLRYYFDCKNYARTFYNMALKLYGDKQPKDSRLPSQQAIMN